MKNSDFHVMRMLAAAIIFPLIAAIGAFGQSTTGNLDPTFGSGGTVRTDFSGNIDRANALAIQADGKIVAAGSSFSSSKTLEDFIVARYNANGSLDKKFGNNGKITTDFFRNVDTINALTIQPDGKIVVAGFAQLAGSGGTPRVFALARYTSDGRPDPGFGSGGSLTTSFGGTFASISAIMLQPDGKIVVAGTTDFNPGNPSSGLDFAVARYHANGSLDASFGDAGKVVFDFFGSFDQANAAVLQPDGKIIVVGSASYDSFNTDIGFALTRINPDGSTDFGFGSGGKQITAFFDAGAKANGVVLQPDGKFIVAGTASDSATRPVATDFALARYNSDGNLDTSFGIGGATSVPFSDSAAEQANALVLARDGKIVVAGTAFKTFATPPDFALRRYNSDGSIDTSFGQAGSVTTDFSGGTDNAQAVAIQADGNIVVAGRAFRNSFDLTLARYLNNVAPVIDAEPPTVPTNLSATFNAGTNAIDLSWTPATDNLGVTGYRIFRDGESVSINTVTGTTFSDNGQSGTHTYAVAAIDAAGNQSGLSNTVTATIPVQSQVTLTNVSLNPTTVTAPANSLGTVTLSGPAPAGGLSVTLRSSETRKATVPATITVPEGATSATFIITTLTGDLGGGDNRVTISATLDVTRSATLTIIRP